MGKVLSGLVKVEKASTLDGTKTEIAGKISAESSVEVPPTTTETTTGLLFGGGQVNADIMLLDFAGYEAEETDMVGDTENQYILTFADGTVLKTKVLVQPIVERAIGVNARDGVVAWHLRFEYYHFEPVMEDVTP
ncbi:MAG: hypothetical protein LC650_03420 [Actinobacteria bacterium]|nr:hypothetical protein [Actinomycetota bacterium]